MSKKARVAVITLQAVKNYGSVLQAYATQVVLERLDQDVVIIDYIREFNLDNKIADKITENDKGLKKIAKEIVLYPTIKKWKKVFNDFLKKNLNLTKKVYTYPQDFIENPIEADVFCVGSDQVYQISQIRIEFQQEILPENPQWTLIYLHQRYNLKTAVRYFL